MGLIMCFFKPNWYLYNWIHAFKWLFVNYSIVNENKIRERVHFNSIHWNDKRMCHIFFSCHQIQCVHICQLCLDSVLFKKNHIKEEKKSNVIIRFLISLVDLPNSCSSVSDGIWVVGCILVQYSQISDNSISSDKTWGASGSNINTANYLLKYTAPSYCHICVSWGKLTPPNVQLKTEHQTWKAAVRHKQNWDSTQRYQRET